jgi:hypothetical protein
VSSPFFQPVDPAGTPPAETPPAGPADAAGWEGVTPSGMGPAAYDISAPQSIAGITAAFDAANALTGAGGLYPQGPRQAAAEALLDSPQGAGEASITAGFPDYQSADVSPGANLETPIQGMGTYPGTMQPGVPQFMAGLGGEAGNLPGLTPETGSMGDSAGGDYPGTTQDGLAKYGTS